jgi:hypothetical protein
MKKSIHDILKSPEWGEAVKSAGYKANQDQQRIMTTQPEQWDWKRDFEANFLDGDKIDDCGKAMIRIDSEFIDFISQLLKTQHKQSYTQGVIDSKNILESYDTWGYEEVARNELDKLLDNLEKEI